MNAVEITPKALQVAKGAALKAGERARELRASENFSVTFKGERDLLTEADLQCEKIILDEIKQEFPDHQILSEESEPPELKSLSTGPLWVIDPIDGTTNFAHGQHCVGVSIAFVYDGIRMAGAVYCPFLNELFYASKGGGAFCNDKPISVSNASELQKALICTGFPYQRERLDGVLFRLKAALENCRDLRRLGAASVDLCFTACGRLDGFYEDLKPWDVAAGLLIASEAGASISRYEDKNSGFHAWQDPEGHTPDEIDGTNLIVSAPGIGDQLRQILSPSNAL